jgi:hypothetical protein
MDDRRQMVGFSRDPRRGGGSSIGTNLLCNKKEASEKRGPFSLQKLLTMKLFSGTMNLHSLTQKQGKRAHIMSSTANLPKVAVHAKEGAVLIRKALKVAFPKTKFSVVLAPGNAIRIRYSDFTQFFDVKKVAMQFGSEMFDMNGNRSGPREYQQYRELQTKDGRILHTIYAMVYVEQEAV